MSLIPTITEQHLRNLNPAGLDGDFLARLTASAEGTLTNLLEDEAAFENQLRAIAPRTIPASLHASLLVTLGDSPFAVDDKILLFNKPTAGSCATGKGRNTFRFNLAAAAAVALLGAIAAFMVPTETAQEQSVDTGDAPESFSAPFAPVPSLVAPINRNLSDTRDEGVVWRGKNQPHRVLRLTYMDQVTVLDADGNPVTEQRPRVEYIIIPEKID
jgi:hypothetical protein